MVSDAADLIAMDSQPPASTSFILPATSVTSAESPKRRSGLHAANNAPSFGATYTVTTPANVAGQSNMNFLAIERFSSLRTFESVPAASAKAPRNTLCAGIEKYPHDGRRRIGNFGVVELP